MASVGSTALRALGRLQSIGAVQTRRHASSSARKVNAVYQPGVAGFSPSRPHVEGQMKKSEAILANPEAYLAGLDTVDWDQEDLRGIHHNHGLMTWNAHGPSNAGAIKASHGEGVYFWDTDGHKYLDFNSMAMCCNLGHTVDQSIIDAIVDQLETLPYAYPGMFISPIRAKLSKLLADIVPGDINTFMFPSAGTEAVEGAMRIAQRLTGRHKIFSRHRSYHGHTLGAMQATGDFRRHCVAGLTGDAFVKFMGPYPYSYAVGQTEEEITYASLTALEEQLKYENPESVAAIIMECIPGTNGVLPPPKGYIAGVRDLCDKYGIMLIADEVMAGFGRTGKLFAFCHGDIVPDIITFAKGVNGAYIPLAGIGVRDHIAEHFRDNNVMVGSTYHSHPVAVASAYAALKVNLKVKATENAANMQPIMEDCMNAILDKHPSVKQARCVGLFGALDIQKNSRGDFIGEVDKPMHPAMLAFKKDLYSRGLFTMMRGHCIFTNPPLIINEEQIREGFGLMSESLTILDENMDTE